MSTLPLLHIHTDGASRGNPGKAAYAYVIELPDGDPIEEADCLGTMTNNQAEYTALVRALEHALELGARHRIMVQSDSELLVKQMRGEYQVKNEDLRELFQQAQALRQKFDGTVTFQHVRRQANSRADALCNEVLDGKRLPGVRDLLKPKGPIAAKGSAAAESEWKGQAFRVLQTAASAWQQGKPDPSVESVWQKLVQIFERYDDGRVGRQ
jgi:ribonuclease HI